MQIAKNTLVQSVKIWILKNQISSSRLQNGAYMVVFTLVNSRW